MPAIHPDEDYINKSLLASLDAQADAEPIPSSDDSSSGSPSHHLRAQEAYYNAYRPQDYSSDEYDYRNSFNSYPNTTRSRQNTFYQDMYPQHMTSPPQSHTQAYESRTSYEFTNGANGAHNKYHLDQYPSALLQGKSSQPQTQTYSNGVQITSQTPYGPHLPSNAPSAPAVSATGPSLVGNGVNSNSNTAGEEISTIFVVGFPEDMQEREFQNMFTFSPGFEAATLKIPNKEYTSYGGLVGGSSGATVLPNGARGATGFGAFSAASQNDPYNLVTVNVDNSRDVWGSATGGVVSSEDLVAAASSNPHFLSSINGLTVAAASGANSSNIPPRKQIIGFAKFRSREEALNARDVLQGRRVDIEKGAVLKAEMAKKNLHTKRGVGPVQGVVTSSGSNGNIPGVAGPPSLQQQHQHIQAPQQPQMQLQSHHTSALDSLGNVADFRDPTGLNGLSRLGWRDSLSSLQSQPSLASMSVPTELSLSHNGSTTSLVNGLPGTPSMANNVPSALNERLTEQQEELRKRDSLVNTLNMGSLSLTGTPTTPTLRGRDRGSIIGGVLGLDDERRKDLREITEQDTKEKEITHNLMRLRERNSAAFDAFHSVGAVPGTRPIAIGMSRQTSATSNGAGITPSSTSSITSLTSMISSVATSSTAPTSVQNEGSPMLPKAETYDDTPFNDLAPSGTPSNQDEIVGPWDRHTLALPLAPGAGRARSETGRSTSPPPQPFDDHVMTHVTIMGGNGDPETHSLANDTSQPLASSAPVTVPDAQTQATHVQNSLSSSISTTSNISTSSSSAASTGNTSPTLPSPASGVSIGSGIMSVGSGGSGSGSSNAGSVSTTGALVRGTVDQNPPINTLYVGNLPTSPPPNGYPTDVLEDTLREVFQQRPGYRKLCFRQKAAGPMCFVEFEDVPFAARAMAEMTGHTLRGLVKNGIRLSYSKNPLGVRTPTSASSGGPTLQQQQQLMQTLSNHHHAQFQQRHEQQDGFQTRLQDEFVGGMHHQQQQHQLQRGGMPQLLRRDSTLSSNQGPVPPPQGGPHPFLHLFQQQHGQPQQHHHNGSYGIANNMNGNPNNTFLSSPPPRFYSTSPGGMTFASAASSTPLTGASSTFVPRSTTNGVIGGGPMVAAYGAMLGGGHHPISHHGGFNSPPTSFSPFGAFGASQGDHSVQFGQLQQHSIPDGPQSLTHDD
ncbi:hypothetical protein CPB83DRAFT_889121 [Crepidotus variabilis]|uniref:RRM domain-containing protein n=1 Tax=Crepidotus variabilis TaxID=179855 RepID=A0A9P6JVP3_9AGAR|nr:hypothetical protein CPB83DRAFT_889121 [Crepidotus variabilis]